MDSGSINDKTAGNDDGETQNFNERINTTVPAQYKIESHTRVPVSQVEIDKALKNESSSADDIDTAVISSSGDNPNKSKNILSRLGIKSNSNKKNFKLLYVPREDYLKYFAMDNYGKYCGTAPEGDPGRRDVIVRALADEALQSKGREDQVARYWNKDGTPKKIFQTALENITTLDLA